MYYKNQGGFGLNIVNEYFQYVKYNKNKNYLKIKIEINIDNKMRDKFIKNLAEYLSKFTNLTTLDLTENDLTGEGIEHLTKAFKENNNNILSKLTTLNLSQNLIGNEDMKFLEEALSKLTNLTMLDLTENEIKNEDIQNLNRLNLEINI